MSGSVPASSARLALRQGVFYVASGVWPLVSLRSFEAVTGPKPEGWLVKTVGALITVIGAVLAEAGSRRSVGLEMMVLGAGSAGALAGIDVWYAGHRRRISPIYLLDGLVQLGIVTAWGAAARSRFATKPRA